MECLICAQRKIPQGSCSVCMTRRYETCSFCKREDPQRPKMYSAGTAIICDECICERFHKQEDIGKQRACNFCSGDDGKEYVSEPTMICDECLHLAHESMQTAGKHCSFCGSFFEDVEHLITGPVNICNRCFEKPRCESKEGLCKCVYCGNSNNSDQFEFVHETPLCRDCVALCSEIFAENAAT